MQPEVRVVSSLGCVLENAVVGNSSPYSLKVALDSCLMSGELHLRKPGTRLSTGKVYKFRISRTSGKNGVRVMITADGLIVQDLDLAVNEKVCWYKDFCFLRFADSKKVDNM